MITYNATTGFGTSSLMNNRLFHGFGTKKLGDGTSGHTSIALLHDHSHEPAHIVIPKQTHSTNVCLVDCRILTEKTVFVSDTDALVTNQKNVLLTVVTADCVPIIYVDIARSIIAISHGGWKGTLNNIPQKVIHQMVEIGAQKENIIAAIGPAISDCCYEIYGKRLELFKCSFNSACIRSEGKKQYLNIRQANRSLLLSAGILPQNIDTGSVCTDCDESRFWSYHRDHHLDGEMLHFVMMQ